MTSPAQQQLMAPEQVLALESRRRLVEGLSAPEFSPAPGDELLAAVGSSILVQTWEAMSAVTASDYEDVNVDGRVHMAAALLRESAEVSAISMALTVAGVYTGPDSPNENLMGIYQITGDGVNPVRLAQTTHEANLFKTAGIITRNLSGGPFLLEAGLYFLAMLYNFTSQTTSPRSLARSAGLAAAANPLIAAAPFINNVVGGQTVLPATIALSAVASNSAPRWMALS